MANGVYRITEEFEGELSKYTGSPYVITVDSQSNALYLCLIYENVKGKRITIPNINSKNKDLDIDSLNLALMIMIKLRSNCDV